MDDGATSPEPRDQGHRQIKLPSVGSPSVSAKEIPGALFG
jgi:hypothetical protein